MMIVWVDLIFTEIFVTEPTSLNVDNLAEEEEDLEPGEVGNYEQGKTEQTF